MALFSTRPKMEFPAKDTNPTNAFLSIVGLTSQQFSALDDNDKAAIMDLDAGAVDPNSRSFRKLVGEIKSSGRQRKLQGRKRKMRLEDDIEGY